MSDSPNISVCLCTFRRAHVAKTIQSVLAQQGFATRSFEIIVADDDPAGSAESMVAAAAKETSVSVRYVHSGARNVSAARNTCLDAARGEWLAFIDDDEIAQPDWLQALLAVQARFGADIVKGLVRGVYPPQTPAWIKRGDPYTRDYGADGARPPGLAAGNVLFRRALIKSMHFDPAFGRSGGEDSDFFRRLCETGAKAIAARSAVVDEIVPEERVTIAYLKARARRIGQTDGRKARASTSDNPPPLAVIKALIGALLLWTFPLFRLFGGAIAFRAFAKFWYSIGVLEGLAGRASEEM